MEALAPTTTLAAISTLPDPISALGDLARAVTVEPDGTLLIFGAPLDAYEPQQIVDFGAAFRALAARIGQLGNDCNKAVEARMFADGATELYHPRYEVTYKPGKGETMVHGELLYNALQPLVEAGKCDPEAAGKAVARVETVVFKTHLTYIKQLDKFGGEVAAAVKAAVREGDPTPARLVIREKK